MIKRIINYLKNNKINCHVNKSARNDRVCHYKEQSDEVIRKPQYIATKIRDFLAMTNKQFTQHSSLFSQSAFTLAETLIVMGIIGVVAALTLPNLNSSTGDKEKVAKVKKLYQNLEDAMGRAQAVYGPVDEWFTNDTTDTAKATRFGERITEFLKVSKNCGVTTNGNCFTTGDSKIFSGDSYINFNSSNLYYKVILADGTSVAFGDVAEGSDYGIIFDIDGPNKGSYTMGKDVFELVYYEDKGGFERDWIHVDECIDFGKSCAQWILQYDNMDYLKTDISGKCPDGKTVLDGTTNTTCK